jgi:hypothetical protein
MRRRTYQNNNSGWSANLTMTDLDLIPKTESQFCLIDFDETLLNFITT